MNEFIGSWAYGSKNFINGGDCAALGVLLCNPGVISILPSYSQQNIISRLSSIISKDDLPVKMVCAENSKSAISITIGSQLVGVRTFIVMSSKAVAQSGDVIRKVSQMRLPIVMCVVNVSSDGTGEDHQNLMNQRDNEWLQIHCENNQEIIDTIIQACSIAENDEVTLPIMVCMDGDILMRLYEQVDVPIKEQVKDFLQEPANKTSLNMGMPISLASLTTEENYMELKKQQHEAMINSPRLIKEANDNFAREFGRNYGNGLIEVYGSKEPNITLFAMGSICGTIKEYIDNSDEKIKLVRIRSFRPFPKRDIESVAGIGTRIGVIDRSVSLGKEGPLFTELKGVIGSHSMNNFITGLGGRNVNNVDIDFIVKNAGDGRNYWVNCTA